MSTNRLRPQRARYRCCIALIDWIDEFHFTATNNGALTMYNFDSTNDRSLVPGAANNQAALVRSGRYLYGLKNNADHTEKID